MTPTSPTEEQILQAIREELKRIKVPGAAEAGMDSDWGELDVDSLDLVELVTALEDRFGIKIEDEELKGIASVGDAVRLVSRLRTQGVPA